MNLSSVDAWITPFGLKVLVVLIFSRLSFSSATKMSGLWDVSCANEVMLM